MRAAIYARVSSDEQVDGYSLDAQLWVACPPETVPGYIRPKGSKERGRYAGKKIWCSEDHKQTQRSRGVARLRPELTAGV